jgi:hypothetical protein
MGYAHHVFLSYQHAETIAYWVRRYFRPHLREWIDQALAPYGQQVRIFLDEDGIEAGDKWRGKIASALRGSCVIVPVLCPTYFNSPHCWAELMTFREREKALAAGGAELILPIVACHGDNFPRDVLDAQYADFTAFVTKSTAFEAAADFRAFETRTQQFARAVVGKLQRVPAHDATWPVVDFADPRVLAAASRHEPLIGLPSLAAA